MSRNKIEDTPGWAERSRLEYIERVLFWRGWVNRRDLTHAFGISMPQASNDLVCYSTLSEGGCRYEVRSKRYETVAGFEPRLVVPQLWADLSRLSSTVWSSADASLLAVPELPLRLASQEVCQGVVRAVFAKQAVTVRYWSAHSASVEKRVISPRAFANDGLRVHVRAYCHRDEKFKDFVLSRIESVLGAFPCDYLDVKDEAWENQVTMKICANPELNAIARKTIERDYGMKRGKLSLTVREAMLFYTARRLGFITCNKQELPILNEVGELQLLSVG